MTAESLVDRIHGELVVLRRRKGALLASFDRAPTLCALPAVESQLGNSEHGDTRLAALEVLRCAIARVRKERFSLVLAGVLDVHGTGRNSLKNRREDLARQLRLGVETVERIEEDALLLLAGQLAGFRTSPCPRDGVEDVEPDPAGEIDDDFELARRLDDVLERLRYTTSRVEVNDAVAELFGVLSSVSPNATYLSKRFERLDELEQHEHVSDIVDSSVLAVLETGRIVATTEAAALLRAALELTGLALPESYRRLGEWLLTHSREPPRIPLSEVYLLENEFGWLVVRGEERRGRRESETLRQIHTRELQRWLAERPDAFNPLRSNLDPAAVQELLPAESTDYSPLSRESALQIELADRSLKLLSEVLAEPTDKERPPMINRDGEYLWLSQLRDEREFHHGYAMFRRKRLKLLEAYGLRSATAKTKYKVLLRLERLRHGFRRSAPGSR